MALPLIPFNRPTVVGREYEYVRDAVAGGHTSSSGPFSKRASALLREELSAADVYLTTSCTSALEMSALLLDGRPGDTVIVPSFTFVSSALAFARAGFGIVFADIEPTNLGIDPQHVATLLDETTRAVIAVHYGGISCDLDGLQAVLSDCEDVDLIEDNAHGLFGTHRDKPLGAFGRFSTLSFHETKNIVCGEGGALVVNRASDIDRARVILDKGTDRQSFLAGEIDKYTWQDTGSSFGLSDLNAAFLLAQLEHRREILAKRRAIFEAYFDRLDRQAVELGLTLPATPNGGSSGYHSFHVLLPNTQVRDRVLRRMRDKAVQATFHYIPLDSSPGGRRFAARHTDCPVTADVSSRLLRLPFYNNLTEDDVDRVVDTFVESMSG